MHRIVKLCRFILISLVFMVVYIVGCIFIRGIPRDQNIALSGLKKGMTKSQVKKALKLPWYTMCLCQTWHLTGESEVEVIGSWPPGFWMNSGKQVVLYFDKTGHLSSGNKTWFDPDCADSEMLYFKGVY